MLESREMYLETILVLSNRLPEVHSVDVAEEMGFSKPSVSRAVGILKDGGFITMDSDGALKLTEEGRKQAEKIYERHTILTEVLKRMGVDPENAENDACKIEHDLSDVTFEAIRKYYLSCGG